MILQHKETYLDNMLNKQPNKRMNKPKAGTSTDPNFLKQFYPGPHKMNNTMKMATVLKNYLLMI